MADGMRPKKVSPGKFPFPVSHGPEESRYLTWLRNHSNYMIESGLSDYLRIVAVLVRGIVINFLILLPYFLFLAAALALMHLYLSQPVSLTFTFEDHEDHGLHEEESTVEQLTVTMASNFGEVRAKAFDFDIAEGKTGGSTIRLIGKLNDSGWLFDNLTWTRSIDGIIIVNRNDGSRAEFTEEQIIEGDVAVEFNARSPLFFSGVVLAFATFIILIFPIGVRMTKVKRFRRAQVTGSLSSVVLRDRFERLFGSLLLLVIVVAALESFPRLSVFFHTLRDGNVAIAIPTFATLVGGLVGANQILPLLGGMAKKIAVIVVGLLGLMIPLVVILFVIEFIVYYDMIWLEENDWDLKFALFLLVLPLVFALLLFATWIIGIKEFSWMGHVKLIALFLGMILLGAVLVIPVFFFDIIFDEVNIRYLFAYYVVAIGLEIMVYCWLTVDVNQTSINGLYRDRLASAYLVGADTHGDVDIEQDIDLQEICNYDARSTAPYHIINVALNLQATKDIGIRDRNSDFFMFSKRFIGGERTGYCKSENMEAVFPQIDLGTAMAVSAAAASPNMGRATNPLMVAFMTLVNIRLGFWVPHPDRLEKYLAEEKYDPKAANHIDFADVFAVEMSEIAKRRLQIYGPDDTRELPSPDRPSVRNELVGVGFSGGGIRSATLNLGIAQAMYDRGVFDHLDFMSTVSGGGYLGSSLSTLMRHKTSPFATETGELRQPDPTKPQLEIKTETGDIIKYDYADTAWLSAEIWDGLKAANGAPIPVRNGTRLMARTGLDDRKKPISVMDGYSWRVRPRALRDEMLSRLSEDNPWVNLSDGGHIENMATLELLRRRCKIVFIGDAEADPNLHFFGLATLVRTARIDLGVEIKINVDKIRLDADTRTSDTHFAVGEIRYPDDDGGVEETGYLIYMKSSFVGDEDEVIKEYRDRNPAFPHESTADQLFDEGQFEAYRALGQEIAESALPGTKYAGRKVSYKELEQWAESELKKAPKRRHLLSSPETTPLPVPEDQPDAQMS